MHDLWWIVIGFGIMLLISIQDIKTLRIPIWELVVIFLIAVLYRAFSGEVEFMDILLALSPGLFLMALSLITDKKIGLADGILVLGLGIEWGLERCVYILMIALIANSLFALTLFTLHKVNKNTRIPFAPFLTLGMGVVTFCV